MKDILINLPDDVNSKLEAQAKLQRLSLNEYIEKLAKAKAFSATLDSLRGRIQNIIQTENILNEDDLNKYLKSE